MRRLLLITAFVSPAVAAYGNDIAGISGLTTNLTEMLPYIERFAEAFAVQIPSPLTTNAVTRFQYIKYIEGAGIEIQRRWEFGFDAKPCAISTFTDRKHSMTVLWRPEDIKPLLQPSKVTKAGAIRLAWKYLNRLGYFESNLPVAHPKVKDWVWAPVNENVRQPLPYFTIEWPWKERPELNFMTVEIDGVRERITQFNLLIALRPKRRMAACPFGPQPATR